MSQSPPWQEISKNGLWTNNPALVQLLGLCPLLAVSGSVVNALGLALATLLVLLGSNLVVSCLRHWVNDAIKLPVFVMVIAAFTTSTELLMQAYTFELYQILGIFIPLIVTNCAILGRADAFACKHRPLPALFDGLMMGIGFLLVLVILGGLREMLGNGTLFANMDLLFGSGAKNWQIDLAFERHLLVALLPPGAFIITGFLIAIKNAFDIHYKNRQQSTMTVGSKRVRTTGVIQ